MNLKSLKPQEPETSPEFPEDVYGPQGEPSVGDIIILYFLQHLVEVINYQIDYSEALDNVREQYEREIEKYVEKYTEEILQEFYDQFDDLLEQGNLEEFFKQLNQISFEDIKKKARHLIESNNLQFVIRHSFTGLSRNPKANSEAVELASKEVSDLLESLDEEIAKKVVDKLFKKAVNVGGDFIKNDQLLRTDEWFSNSDSFQGLTEGITGIANQVEGRVRDVHKRVRQLPLFREESYPSTEREIANKSSDIENRLYFRSKQLIRKNILFDLREDTRSLSRAMNRPLKQVENVNTQTIFDKNSSLPLYDQRINQPIYDHLREKYDRRELGLLEDEELFRPEDEPYEFQSPEGEFLDKNRELYDQLWAANPYHEQGVKAREIGISAVEVADQEFARGDEPTAETAFQVGEAMLDIVLGLTPYVGLGKDVYEALTGQHLLTGRKLSTFERSLSVAGIALSATSAGVLSSGSLKLSIQKTRKIFKKINEKLQSGGENLIIGSPVEKVVKEVPEKIFSSLNEVGLKTEKEFKSAVHFLKRAFPEKNPSVDQVSQVIRTVDNSGLNNFAKALEDLSEQGIIVLKGGEEFLARQLRYQKEILKHDPFKSFRSQDLIEMGRDYAHYYKVVSKTNENLLAKDKSFKVWRAMEKGKGGVFEIHEGSRGFNARYSAPGSPALYTSLRRETVVGEVILKNPEMSRVEIEVLYNIQSKEIIVDDILDLTTTKSLSQLNAGARTQLTKKNLSLEFGKDYPRAYNQTHILGDVARRKKFKGIKAFSSVDGEGVHINLILFEDIN